MPNAIRESNNTGHKSGLGPFGVYLLGHVVCRRCADFTEDVKGDSEKSRAELERSVEGRIVL